MPWKSEVAIGPGHGVRRVHVKANAHTLIVPLNVLETAAVGGGTSSEMYPRSPQSDTQERPGSKSECRSHWGGAVPDLHVWAKAVEQ